VRAIVRFNRRLSPAYRHLGIAAAAFPPAFRAGEFVMVRPPWIGDPLLPRAYSIYRVSSAGPEGASLPAQGPVIEILYKVLGKGTHTLSQMEPGQAVELLGPLGNGFGLPTRITMAVLVAGGIGVPPIAALASQIGGGQGAGPSWQRAGGSWQGEHAGDREAPAAAGLPADPPPPSPKLEVFLGGKTAEDILCAADFEAVGAGLHVTTEDGSLGTPGLVTDLLRPFLASRGRGGTRLYACGPPGMLEAVGRLAEALALPCELSLEANMACGFGACMGCAIEARSKGTGLTYKLVCKDGPVFDSRELVWG
jgi:dihydroorotate dehydrogenase electron transfer subunit